MDPVPASRPTAKAVSVVIGRALDAYRVLAELGEEIADEWQYVTDLTTVHAADLEALRDGDPDRVLGPAVVAAVDAAITEIELIADPHRAIDWLSTFPQIVRLAVAPPASAAAGAGAAPAAGG